MGKQKYKNEVVYSILSYLKIAPSSNVKIIIITDDSNTFKKVFSNHSNIIIHEISKDTINEWLNYKSYMPRIKIKALQYFFKNYNGNVLFIDSDTFFFKNIDDLFEKIEQKKLVMYCRCTDMTDMIRLYQPHHTNLPHSFQNEYKLYKHIEKERILKDEDNSYDVNTLMPLYNSGVIGMHSQYAVELKKVLNLCDIINKQFTCWCAEEFAFSLIFNNLSEIITCDGSVYHYCNTKFSRFLLAYYFDYFHEEDNKEYEDFLHTIVLNQLGEIDFKYEEIPNLSYFIQFYLPPLLANFANRQIARTTTENSKENNNQNFYGQVRPYFHANSFNTIIRNNFILPKTYMSKWKKIIVSSTTS